MTPKVNSEMKYEVVKSVKRNFYINDCLRPVKSYKNAVEVADQLRNIFSKGVFRLTKWLCNRPEVLNSIPQVERALSVLDLDLDKEKPPI